MTRRVVYAAIAFYLALIAMVVLAASGVLR
jgi:hypothetical protein